MSDHGNGFDARGEVQSLSHRVGELESREITNAAQAGFTASSLTTFIGSYHTRNAERDRRQVAKDQEFAELGRLVRAIAAKVGAS